MKVSREARRLSRQIFRACLVDGKLDEAGLRGVVKLLVEKKPRHYVAVLHRLHDLLEKEVDQRTFSVASAVPLVDEGASILKDLTSRFGAPLATRYRTNPNLIAGLRVRVGSNVWDGSLRQKVAALNKAV